MKGMEQKEKVRWKKNRGRVPTKDGLSRRLLKTRGGVEEYLSFTHSKDTEPWRVQTVCCPPFSSRPIGEMDFVDRSSSDSEIVESNSSDNVDFDDISSESAEEMLNDSDNDFEEEVKKSGTKHSAWGNKKKNFYGGVDQVCVLGGWPLGREKMLSNWNRRKQRS